MHVFSPHAHPRTSILHDEACRSMVMELRGQEHLSVLKVKTLLWVFEPSNPAQKPRGQNPKIKK